jgi:hypothetical protein
LTSPNLPIFLTIGAITLRLESRWTPWHRTGRRPYVYAYVIRNTAALLLPHF